MLKLVVITFNRSKIGQLILMGCLIALFGLILPATALAEPPVPVGAETCARCHEEETTAWQDSPHARASNNSEGAIGATCEACHGAYVEGHPDEGVMRLTVDSSVCKDCHTNTFEQWEDSIHAQAGVQCIGCHLSHSQEFRLTDEALCGSCHRDRVEDFSHSVHGLADVACIDCHLSSTTSEMTIASTNVSDGIRAPSHDFTGVSSEDCLRCHGPDVHKFLPAPDQVIDARMLAMADSVPKLTAELETTQQTNKMLQIIAPVSLGLGIGIGGMLGIIFMLVVGYINQRRAK
jgi:hypothetical protein